MKTTKFDWNADASDGRASPRGGAEKTQDARPMTRTLAEWRTKLQKCGRKTLRRALGLTQEEFAARFQIPLGTLRDWEQGKSEPDQSARAYLRAIAGDAAAVERALQAGPRSD